MSSSSPWLRKLLGRMLTGVSISLVLGSFPVNAALVENILTFNAKAYSLGNAVTADYVGVDSLQYNPAALIHLRPGFSTEFKMLGAPLVQVVRKTAQTLTPKHPSFNLFYKGYTVRCDSPYRPYSDVDAPGSTNPGRDPVSGGLDPSIRSVDTGLPDDLCIGPELVNPNGIFLDDPLDDVPTDIDRIIPIPIPLPLYLPNIGYKESENARLAFAAQVFTNAPLPKIEFGDIALLNALGVQRLTFTPGFAFQVTDKLSVGAALRVSKSYLQAGVGLDAGTQLFGFMNAVIHDSCKTNETRRNSDAARVYDDLLNCAQLYVDHQKRVDDGLARESGYWPFLPWEPIATVHVEGSTSLIYGWNFGVQWQPMPWITWGATYRTKEDDVYSADGSIYYSTGLQNLFTGFQSDPILGFISNTFLLDGAAEDDISLDLNIPWPSAFSTGVSMQLSEKLKVNYEYRKYKYSAWKTWDATITSTELNAIRLLSLISPNNSGATLGIPAGGVDTSYTAWGVEYQWNRRLAYRAGIEDRPFLDDEGGLIPVYGIEMISVGAAYKLTHDKEVDIGLTRLVIDGTSPSKKTLSNDPFAVLSLRGAQYENVQLDAGIIMFTAGYTHRF